MAEYPKANLLVEPDWLAQHVDDPNVRVVDARGAPRYAEGHIKNAVNLPVARLDDPSAPVRSTLLPAERFATVVGGAGVGTNQTVVIYDDGPGLMSSRLFWALEYYGHPNVKVLNGGIARWMAEARAVVSEPTSVQPAEFQAQTRAERGATKQEVSGRLKDSGTVILDVRSKDEYTGAVSQALRGGHIPGAKWRDWSDSLQMGGVPVLKAAGELQKGFQDAGVTPDKEVITYCQGGVRAAHSYYVLRLLGFDKVRNYTGSWGDWGNDPSLPAEQGG